MRLEIEETLKEKLKRIKGENAAANLLLANNKKENINKRWATDIKSVDNTQFSFSLTDDSGTKSAPANCKIGRIFKLIFKQDFLSENLSPKDVEDFVNLLKAEESSDLKIVGGADVKHYYRAENYYRVEGGGGSLWSSCMRNYMDACGDWYVENDLKMLVKLKEGKVVARALLWDSVDFDGTEKKLMDRIYYINDHDVQTFKKWAKQNGYCSKYEQSHGAYSKFHDENGDVFRCNNVTTKLKTPHIEGHGIPYLDTMWCISSDNIASNHVRKFAIFKARDQYGQPNPYDTHIDAVSGLKMCAEFLTSCREGYAEPENVIRTSSGENILKSNSVQIGEGIYHKDDVKKSKRYAEYIFSQNAEIVELRDGDFVYAEDAVKCIDGSYSFLYEAKRSNIHGGWVDPSTMEVRRVSDGNSSDYILEQLISLWGNRFDGTLERARLLAKCTALYMSSGIDVIPMFAVTRPNMVKVPKALFVSVRTGKSLPQALEEYGFTITELQNYKEYLDLGVDLDLTDDLKSKLEDEKIEWTL